MQLSIDNLTKVYPDGTRALDGLSFDVSPGEGVVILGHNGCGKSTLMKCLTGLERPTSGRLSLAGLDLTSASRRELRPPCASGSAASSRSSTWSATSRCCRTCCSG